MAYLTQAEFLAELPAEFQTEALDDDRDAAADTGLFTAVLASAEERVNAVLDVAGVELPLTAPYADAVKNATRMFVLELLFARRAQYGDKNPWTEKAKDALKLLEKWASDNSETTSGGDWGSDTKLEL